MSEKTSYDDLELKVSQLVEQNNRHEQNSEELQKTNRLLQGVLNAIPDIIGIQKPDHTIVQYNKAGYESLRLSHEEVKGRTCFSLLNRKSPCEKCATSRAICSKKLEELEKYVPELDKYFLCRSNPILDDDGEVCLIVEQLHDITERKLSEKELSKVKDMLDKTSRMARVGGWEKNFITGEDNWSEVTREIHDVGPEFVPDIQSAINFYKEGESQEKITEVVKRCIEEGKPYDVEVELVTAKNKERWIRTMGHAEFHDGQCVRLFGTFQDITDNKIAEKTIEEERSFLKKLMDTSPSCITVLDSEGRIIMTNPAAERILGLKQSELNFMLYNDPAWSITDLDGNIYPDENLPFQIVKNTKKPVFDIKHAIVWPNAPMATSKYPTCGRVKIPQRQVEVVY